MNNLCQDSSSRPRLRFRTAIFAGLVVGSALALAPSARAVDVLENMNNSSRTGRNSSETILNTSNVKESGFGKLWAYSVDGATYAQPLYASGITIGSNTYNVVFIETMEDDAYAFDADSNTQLWHVSFVGGDITPVPPGDYPSGNNIIGDLGVESTPYIDKAGGTIYMVSKTKNTSNSTYAYTLHALDITSGTEKFGGPVNITASGFNVKQQNQRMGLAEAGGNIIITWTSYQDSQPYHGWMMAYNATTLAQTAVFDDTPTGSQGGIWQQGRAPAVDASGNVYVITGNGTWDGSKNFGESFLKLSSSLSLEDWFTPDNYSSLNSGDEDLGSGGPMLIPNTSIVFGGGKQGTVYLCSTGGMGHEKSGNGQIIQSFTFASGEIHGGAVYYDSPVKGPVVYDMANGDHLKEYAFNGSTFNTSNIGESSATAGGAPGGFLAVSDNNGASGSGIVWASIETKDADGTEEPGIVRAWNADDIAGTELWDSNQDSSRDNVGTFVKDANPTVANGKVYVGSYSSQVSVYGLLEATVAAPTFNPGGGNYTSAQSVTISDSTSGASINYTTDGSTPSPTHGTAYTGPVSISSTTTLQAIAFESGFANSSVASATYTFGTSGSPITLIATDLTYSASGAKTSLQTDTHYSNPDTWVELEGTGTGQSITYTTSSIPAGTYQLQMEWKGNNNRGELSLAVDGGAAMTPNPLDQYSSGETYPTTTFSPNLTFSSAATHTIKLTVTGKNSKSSAEELSTYSFILTPE
jgi:hypothetical protein